MIIFFKPSIHLKIRKLFSQTTKESQQVLFFLSSPCKWETSLFAFEVHFVKIPTISKLDVHGWFFLRTIDSSYSLLKIVTYTWAGFVSKMGPKNYYSTLPITCQFLEYEKQFWSSLKVFFFEKLDSIGSLKMKR